MTDGPGKPLPTPQEEESLEEGSLLSHLIELRTRILRAGGAVLFIFLAIVYWANDIFSMVADPLIEKLPAGSTMIATEVASPLLTPFKTTMWAALFLAMPAVIYQVWAFIAPGLYKKEKRFAIPLVVSSIVLFYAGVCFAYFFVFPMMFGFFTATTPVGVQMMTDINEYLNFILVILLAFGLAFEVPIATVMLVWSGLISVEDLTKNRPYVFLGAFVVGMFLTPPDVISQTLLAIPMYCLFEAGIVMCRIMLPKPGTAVTESTQTN